MASMLKWTKANWPAKTYHAETGSLSYTIDWTGNRWNLRGWVDGEFAVSHYAPTMKALKAEADAHALKHS